MTPQSSVMFKAMRLIALRQAKDNPKIEVPQLGYRRRKVRPLDIRRRTIEMDHVHLGRKLGRNYARYGTPFPNAA